jgi:rod shape-determining protein MreD
VIAALLEATLVPHLQFGGAHLSLVLVLGIVWATAIGLDEGLAWAFFGGIAIDVLAPDRALGSSAFVLILCVGFAALLVRLLSRIRYVVPILAVFLLSIAYSTLILVLHGALRGPVAIPDPLQAFLPGAMYDAIVAALIGPAAMLAHDRVVDQERAPW